MKVPFLDLVTPHVELEEELIEVVREALHSARFIGGPPLEGLESEFAAFCRSKHCVGVGSGTDALRFALIAAGIGRDDAVITVSHTFIATAEAISQTGAMPEFVDIEPDSYNIDPVALVRYLEEECDSHEGQLISRRSGKRVRAIVPVHLYGQMIDVDSVMEIAARYNLLVIEDACQAHGAEYFSTRQNAWVRAGSVGYAAAFSFYPGKNLGACGEAGAVTTGDDEIARCVRMLRDHGQVEKYYHDIEGYNGRLDAIQAGFLRVKLKHLEEWNRKRQEVADRYRELLGEIEGITLPSQPGWSRHVYHLYVIRHPERQRLAEHLKEKGIDTGLHYPLPVHLQDAYRRLGYGPGDLPVTEKVAGEILSLPMFPGLAAAQQEFIAGSIQEFLLTAKA